VTNELQQTRYDRTIRRVGGIIGPGSKVAEALGELFPVIDVERIPGELLALGGTGLAQGSSILTAAAGERPSIMLFNPVDSGKLITVTTVFVSSSTGQIIRWNVNTTPLAVTVVGAQFRDGRLGIGTIPAGTILEESKVATTVTRGQGRVLSGDMFQIKDDNSVAVLSPGSGMEVGGANVATTLNVSFAWRERAAEQSELNF